VYSSKLYDFYKYRDCNGSCVRKSDFCAGKDVCEFPKFVCFNKCQPASYRRWYQVGICPFYCSVLPKHLIWCAATNVCHLTLLAVWYKVCPSEELHFVCGQTEIPTKEPYWFFYAFFSYWYDTMFFPPFHQVLPAINGVCCIIFGDSVKYAHLWFFYAKVCEELGIVRFQRRARNQLTEGCKFVWSGK